MSKRLDEIEARIKAATPGPWKQRDKGAWTEDGGCKIAAVVGAPQLIRPLAPWGMACNAALIANAPSDLAILLRVARASAAYRRALDDRATTVEEFGRALDELRAALDELESEGGR